jgi:hypothetical protein
VSAEGIHAAAVPVRTGDRHALDAGQRLVFTEEHRSHVGLLTIGRTQASAESHEIVARRAGPTPRVGFPAVVWNRQAAVYMRDDREVMLSGAPRFDIVERQDREAGTVWLRTSKVPYACPAGQGTVGGFDTISAAHAAELARKRR